MTRHFCTEVITGLFGYKLTEKRDINHEYYCQYALEVVGYFRVDQR